MTRRKRRLKYIREKNHYRTGGKGAVDVKVSKQMTKDELFLKDECNQIIKELQDKYKMKFKIVDYEIALWEEDILNDLITVRLIYKRDH